MNKEIIKNAIYLNGEKSKTKQELFDYLSKKLNFPDYFSNNWDSFEEILYDLSLNQKVIFYNFDECLANDSENLETLKDIINQFNKETTVFYFLKSNF